MHQGCLGVRSMAVMNPKEEIVFLLQKDLFILILTASLFALPAAYYVMKIWLQNFAYKIDLHFTIFLFSVFAVFIIAGVSMSFQTLKAARSNPVEVLKYE